MLGKARTLYAHSFSNQLIDGTIMHDVSLFFWYKTRQENEWGEDYKGVAIKDYFLIAFFGI